MTLQQKLENRLRLWYGIPDGVEVAWAKIVESDPGAGDTDHPALLVGGDRLAVDILRRRFVTEHQVLRHRLRLYKARAVSEDGSQLLIGTDCGPCSLSEELLDDIYFTAWFSPELLDRANSGQAIY